MPSANQTTTTPTTYASLVQHFTSLLTITIHTLLSARDLYPANSFLTARAFNIPVRQSRHPDVCAWVTSAVTAVAQQLLKSAVARVVFVIFEAEGKGRICERWIWDLSAWPVVPEKEVETRLVRGSANGMGNEPGIGGAGGPGVAAEEKEREKKSKDNLLAKHIVDMEEQFRGLLSRLTTLPSRLRPLPPNCTFTLCIDLRDGSNSPSAAALEGEDAQPPIGHPQPWIPAQPALQKTVIERGNERYGGDVKRLVRAGEDVVGARTVPIRRVEAGEMRFEMWVEEGTAKFQPEVEAEEESEGVDKTGDNGKQQDATKNVEGDRTIQNDGSDLPSSGSGIGVSASNETSSWSFQ